MALVILKVLDHSNVMISAVTFIKNGLSLGHPIKEAIESVSPIASEVIINVGFSDQALTQDDGTYQYLKDIFPQKKFKFVKSWWDPSLTEGGKILAQQTNIALQHATCPYIQYIQGDEAIHEKDFGIIEEGVKFLEKNKGHQGLLFDYYHFYGNVNVVKTTRSVYRREIRLIRNFQDIISWKDAQGFRTKEHKKLLVHPIKAHIYHYGWARKTSLMQKKIEVMNKLYHGSEFQSKEHNYQRIWGLYPFKKTHPTVMNDWIRENTNPVDVLNLPYHWQKGDFRLIFSDSFEKLTGLRLGEYKNYLT